MQCWNRGHVGGPVIHIGRLEFHGDSLCVVGVKYVADTPGGQGKPIPFKSVSRARYLRLPEAQPCVAVEIDVAPLQAPPVGWHAVRDDQNNDLLNQLEGINQGP